MIQEVTILLLLPDAVLQGVTILLLPGAFHRGISEVTGKFEWVTAELLVHIGIVGPSKTEAPMPASGLLIITIGGPYCILDIASVLSRVNKPVGEPVLDESVGARGERRVVGPIGAAAEWIG